MLEFIKISIEFYLIFTFVYTCVAFIRMYATESYANDKKKGRERLKKLMSEGRLKQMPVYTIADIRENRRYESVRLSYFPNDTGKKNRAIIVLPGGGYAHLCTAQEGYPVAARLNELGYSAFILEYRTGFGNTKHAPMHDLAQAVKFIEEHQDEFNVTIEDYILIGFSAGGNLAGIFGTEEWGYKKYGVRKPGSLILGYPWTNINHWMTHPYWNVWVGLFGIWTSERGNLFLFGPGMNFIKENRDSVCVQKWITKDYPKTYMFSGSDDILVPSGSHTDILANTMNKYAIPLMYDRFYRVPHGVGLGERTPAEGWLDRAIKFAMSPDPRQVMNLHLEEVDEKLADTAAKTIDDYFAADE